MASKVHSGAVQLQHYVSFNISSSDDTLGLIDDVPGEKFHRPVPTKEEDHEAVTWKMDMTGCDQVKVYFEKNTKALIFPGIAAGKKTHSCKLNMSRDFELNQVKLMKLQYEHNLKTANRLAKMVVIKVGKANGNKTCCFRCWKGSN